MLRERLQVNTFILNCSPKNRKDQSVVFIGRSGSGKTTNLKHTLTCLAATAAASRPNSKKPVTSPLTSEKVNAMFVLLEAFGNSRTVMNANATRFVTLTKLRFFHIDDMIYIVDNFNKHK